MASEHIVKSYDEELQRLETMLIRMGGLVEAQLGDSLTALSRRDPVLAEAVIGNDQAIDTLNFEIDEYVVRMLALRQPMANDLRAIVAALRIAGDLERIGDYAANISKRTVALTHAQVLKPLAGVSRMGKVAQQILKEVLDAISHRDADLAKVAWERDSEVDEMYTSVFRELLTYMMEDPRNITPCTHVLFMAKNIGSCTQEAMPGGVRDTGRSALSAADRLRRPLVGLSATKMGKEERARQCAYAKIFAHLPVPRRRRS
jgi:phosphate transport system protein